LGEILTWPGPHSRHRSASGWYFERMKTCLEPQASDGVRNSSHWNKNETAINLHAIADSHSCFVCSYVAILKLKLWRCKATPLEFGGKQLHLHLVAVFTFDETLHMLQRSSHHSMVQTSQISGREINHSKPRQSTRKTCMMKMELNHKSIQILFHQVI
jgi:hypothetical protein